MRCLADLIMCRTGNADTLGSAIVCNRAAILTPSPNRSPAFTITSPTWTPIRKFDWRAGGNSIQELFFIGKGSTLPTIIGLGNSSQRTKNRRLSDRPPKSALGSDSEVLVVSR
jgi:hypothetical protein